MVIGCDMHALIVVSDQSLPALSLVMHARLVAIAMNICALDQALLLYQLISYLLLD